MRRDLSVHAAIVIAAATAAHAGVGSPTTTCLSVSSTTGAAGNGQSHAPEITRDGRFVAFSSLASDLVPGDTNNQRDVFVVDLTTGVRTLVSVNSSGVQSNAFSSKPFLSDNGRFVAFESNATNLGGVTGGEGSKVYWRDTVSGTTTLVASASSPISSYVVGMSASGRYVAYVRGDFALHCFVRNMQSGAVVQADIGMNGQTPNGGVFSASLSSDGRYVVFSSTATNLTADAIAPGSWHVFLRDLELGVTTLITRGPDGLEAPGTSGDASISADGRFVAFHSGSQALAPDNILQRLNVFLHDRQTGETIRVNERWAGGQTFAHASNPRITRDGRYITYQSTDGDIVPGDAGGVSDIFMYDRILKRTIPVSRSSTGDPTNGQSAFAVPADGGTRVVFLSTSTSMHSPDENGGHDAFLREHPSGPFCAGDVNGDHAVDMADLMWVVDSFNTERSGPGYNANADQNGDNHVDFADLNIVLSAYHQPC